jgi:predicted amidohydrolase
VNATIVSGCQVTPALGNPAANRELAADAISHAAAQGASVVVQPNWSPAAMSSRAGPMPKPARRRPTAQR